MTLFPAQWVDGINVFMQDVLAEMRRIADALELIAGDPDDDRF